MKIILFKGIFLISCYFGAVAQANEISIFNSWKISKPEISSHHLISRNLANNERLTVIDFNTLSAKVYQQDQSFIISLPLPDGELADFKLTPYTMMESGLANRYSNIKTFNGYQLNQPDNKGKFDITPEGFHGIYKYQGKLAYLEPKYQRNQNIYTSYFKQDALPLTANQKIKLLPPIKKYTQSSIAQEKPSIAVQAQVTFRQYRLAIATTGEYSTFHGGTVANVMAELTTLINRINMIYEQELAVQMILVENNDQLIFTNKDTDPFDNDLNKDIDKNTGVINDAIGNANYDIGHVLSTDGGGLAALGSVCRNSFKGEGTTGSFSPTGNSFYVDLVAHELGHQFGADHTFNGTTDSCGGNRSSDSSYEVGSGSTIMAYAGICGSENIQNRADAVFHSHSMNQINAHLSSNSCGSQVVQSNNAPVANAGNNFTIPANTPFILTASATDQDNDNLTYDWQQFDLGAATNGANDQIDDGSRPIFRAFSPVSQATRIFPRLSDILADRTSLGEAYATTNRDLNFNLIVRDNKGGVDIAKTLVKVVDTGEEFTITSPSSGSSVQSGQLTVDWNIAQTNVAPINCQNVAIELSIDNGTSFSTSLVSSTTNDGQQVVSLPNIDTNQARLKVSCLDNVFFTINKGNFSINSVNNPPVANNDSITIIQGVGTQTINVLVNDTDADTNDVLTLTSINYVGTGQASINNNQISYSPNADFSGTDTIDYTISDNEGVTASATLTITVEPLNSAPVANNDSLTITQGAATQTINVLANDTDVDANDVLSLTSIEYTGTGQASINNNQISYTPSANFSGTETINYTISDSNNATASATVAIIVNAAPVAPQPTETTTSNSGGGSVYWLLFFGFFSLLHRRHLIFR